MAKASISSECRAANARGVLARWCQHLRTISAQVSWRCKVTLTRRLAIDPAIHVERACLCRYGRNCRAELDQSIICVLLLAKHEVGE